MSSNAIPCAVDDRDLSSHTAAELFALYRSILRELRARGVVRTENAPAGDYAEHLVARALGGTLASNSDEPQSGRRRRRVGPPRDAR